VGIILTSISPHWSSSPIIESVVGLSNIYDKALVVKNALPIKTGSGGSQKGSSLFYSFGMTPVSKYCYDISFII
jgi:hypothetical protein